MQMTKLEEINIFAPHPEFTFSNIDINLGTMINIRKLLQEYLSPQGHTKQNKKKITKDFNIGYNHFFLRSIERGFALYLNILPIPFQRIVQMLIANGEVQFTFSDFKSLSCGVNYPIRTVILLGSTNNDVIDSILAHQASGRSGRRGKDTKGFTVYCGVDWHSLISSKYLEIKGTNPDDDYMTLPKEFNNNFDYTRLAKVSLDEFITLTKEQVFERGIERETEILETHNRVIERLGDNNKIHIYRYKEYGIKTEYIMELLLFISSKMYSGLTMSKYELFEMIACIINNQDIELDNESFYESNLVELLLDEFKNEMVNKGFLVLTTSCKKLTRGYKMKVFDEDATNHIMRIQYINEMVRLLYNHNINIRKTHKWVDMLEQIFEDLKSIVFRTII
jgi:hypothetical protein